MAAISATIELYDRMTAPLVSIVNEVNNVVESMREMQSTISEDLDTSSLDSTTHALTQANEAVEQLNRTMASVQQPEWITPASMDIFMNSGIDRFGQELQSANTIAEQLLSTQRSIGQLASSTEIFSGTAVTDIEALGDRIQGIHERIQALEASPVELDDRANNQLEALRAQLSSAIQEQNNLNRAVQGMDVGSANEAFARLQQTVGATERYIRDNLTQPVEVPVEIEWNGINLDVFSGTGMDRFQQEVTSTNQMLSTLSDMQNQIAAQAEGTSIFSGRALQDINSMRQRIQSLQERIHQMENDPLNIGTDSANADLERLRAQLSQAVQAQENLNRAVQNMDVSAANTAYNQLSRTVAGTERYIRDNVAAQEEMNQKIELGTRASSELAGMIKSFLGAYASIQGIGKLLDISDEMTSSRARVNMMNDGLQSTDELMDMIFNSAQDARGSFGDMIDIVARFGNNAKDAFSSNQEVVAFANLIQKQMTIAGASTDEASNAMLQLSQALGSGVLRGDELNSIFEQAPNLIQSIADYMDVPIGKIRAMAADGELTADIVKNAIFASADDINAKFDAMPKTWAQIWTEMQNDAKNQLQPVLDKINDLANNQKFIDGIMQIKDALVNIITFVVDAGVILVQIIPQVIGWIDRHKEGLLTLIEIIAGVAVVWKTVSIAVAAYNTIMGIATTITRIFGVAGSKAFGVVALVAIIALIGVIKSVVSWFRKTNKVTGDMGKTIELAMLKARIKILEFKAVFEKVVDSLKLTWDTLCYGLEFMIGSASSGIMYIIYGIGDFVRDMVNGVIDMINTLIEGINTIPGVSIEAIGQVKWEGLDGIKEYADSQMDMLYDKGLELDKKKQDLAKQWDKKDEKVRNAEIIYEQKYKLYEWLNKDKDKEKKKSGKDGTIPDIPAVSGIKKDTEKIADSVTTSADDLKYLREIASRDYINRFTTASISVKMTNNNTVNNDMDLDGMVDHLRTKLEEQMLSAAEGVH